MLLALLIFAGNNERIKLRKTIVALLLFVSIPHFGQELGAKEFLEFKTMKFGYIEEALILNGWDFKGTETNKRQPGDPDDHRLEGIGYSTVIYEYPVAGNEKILLRVTEYDNAEEKEIQVCSESRKVYEELLRDFRGMNFNQSGQSVETSPYNSVDRLHPGQKILLRILLQSYKKGRLLLKASIREYAVIDTVSLKDDKFSYESESVTEEFVLLF